VYATEQPEQEGGREAETGNRLGHVVQRMHGRSGDAA
jgi:hypothetical protein